MHLAQHFSPDLILRLIKNYELRINATNYTNYTNFVETHGRASLPDNPITQ
jgi:hypothetical protein